MSGRVVVVFRYDDYGASFGQETAAQDDMERRFLAAFAQQGVPLTVGVVPNYEQRRSLADDPAKLGVLREAAGEGRAEPALHGLTHESFAPRGARSSEFAGQPQERQAERLRAGKALLEGWCGGPVVTFIPPWNTYDQATVEALAQTGFQAVSAALSEPSTAPLVAVPHTCGLGELRRTVRWLARGGRSGIVVCMFHHFSFTDSPDPRAGVYGQMTLSELSPLLAWCREQPATELLTVGQAAARHRQALTDGRVDAARERWHLVFRWRRVRGLGWVVRRLWAPRALVAPGRWARGTRWLRRLARLSGDT